MENYFADIVGQKKVIDVLCRAMETGRFSHAYLFSGPAGTGKTMTADLFSLAILLRDDPGGKVYINEGIHPDLMVCERLEKKTVIGIEQITREMEPWLSIKPYRSSHRVVIIREAQLLSPTAANALLKTLEEPPDYAVIILVSDENNLLETIVSRCQRIRFSPLSEPVMEDLLRKRGLEENRAGVYARLGQGSMSRALAFAEEERLDEIWPVARSIIEGMSGRQPIEVFRAAELMEKQPLLIELVEFLLRDLCVFQATGREELLLLKDNQEWCRRIRQGNPEAMRRALFHIASLKKQLNTSVNMLLLCINISYEVMDALQ